MTVVPSRRLIVIVVALSAGALAVVAFPGAWPLVLTANLVVGLFAAIDYAMSPRPSAIEVQRIAPERFSVLSSAKILVRVRNRSRAPLRIRVRDGVPLELSQDEVERSALVPPDGEIEWEYPVLPQTRGKFAWGPIFVRYRSILGLWERDKVEQAAGEARVYPNLKLLERYQLLARTDRLAVLGVRKLRIRGVSTEFESLREYTAGDDIRQMDWKATARRARLIVRNQETERNQTVLILVDCGRLMNAADRRRPDEPPVAKLDHAVTAALMLAHVALARGDRVGLCTFSGKVHAWLTPRGNVAQSRLIGDSLFDLRGDYTESDHARCLRFVAARFPKRSLLVVITDFVDGTTAADMVAHLQLAARRHVVLFAAMKDPFLERAAQSDPRTEREGFRKSAAVDLLRDRLEVLEKIRHAGGFVVDTEPGDIAPAVITNYLEVMLRGLL